MTTADIVEILKDGAIVLGGVSALATALGHIIPGKVGAVLLTIGIDVKGFLASFGSKPEVKP